MKKQEKNLRTERMGRENRMIRKKYAIQKVKKIAVLTMSKYRVILWSESVDPVCGPSLWTQSVDQISRLTGQIQFIQVCSKLSTDWPELS